MFTQNTKMGKLWQETTECSHLQATQKYKVSMLKCEGGQAFSFFYEDITAVFFCLDSCYNISIFLKPLKTGQM